jgi:hypothetical protein
MRILIVENFTEEHFSHFEYHVNDVIESFCLDAQAGRQKTILICNNRREGLHKLEISSDLIGRLEGVGTLCKPRNGTRRNNAMRLTYPPLSVANLDFDKMNFIIIAEFKV